MSNTISATPRPRPPAQIRRASTSNYKASPPPPYRLAFPHSDSDSLVPSGTDQESALFPTATHGHSGEDAEGASASAVEVWLNDRPREELSSLLLRADDMIRDREKELSMTSELSRSLYNNNVALKHKHQALLARLPSNFSVTPDATPISSPAPSPHLYSSSLPRHPSAAPRPRRASRRISVSPSDLALLSDQNAELLYKLEKLEVESSHADQAGKRRLGKLEKEIASLREELEAARTRSDELERHARLLERGSEEASKKRQEWDDRIRALRGKPDYEEDAVEDIRDFAPGGALSIPKPTSALSSGSSSSAPPSATPHTPSTPNHEVYDHNDRLLFPSSSPSPAPPSPAPLEYALVSQLLTKVRELEQANAQIGEHQKNTTAKLREAQMEAETIRRLYACLGDDADVELEIVDDDEPRPSYEDAAQGLSSTVRFRSLKRSIHGDVSRLSIDGAFEGGIASNMHSTIRTSDGPGGALKSNAPHKNRKTVVGLFDTLESPASQSSPTAYGDVFDSRSHAVLAARSPPMSPVDFPAFSPDPSVHSGSRLPTLGSELGSEFGDDWVGTGENHHLRSSSLYSLNVDTAYTPETSPIPSPSAERPPLPSIASTLARGHQSVESPPSGVLSGQASLSRKATLPDDLDKTPKSAYSRSRRLSETVLSRTYSWIDRRFQPTPSQSLRRRPTLPVFEDGDAPVGLSSQDTVTALSQVAAPLEERLGALSDPVPNAQTPAQPGGAMSKKQRVTALMLEIWLWIQFAIIIFVFLWAMAKRGPKSIVMEAERNRASRTA